MTSKGHGNEQQQPSESQPDSEGLKEYVPIDPGVDIQEQVIPHEPGRQSALGKFCGKWPSLRPRVLVLRRLVFREGHQDTGTEN